MFEVVGVRAQAGRQRRRGKWALKVLLFALGVAGLGAGVVAYFVAHPRLALVPTQTKQGSQGRVELTVPKHWLKIKPVHGSVLCFWDVLLTPSEPLIVNVTPFSKWPKGRHVSNEEFYRLDANMRRRVEAAMKGFSPGVTGTGQSVRLMIGGRAAVQSVYHDVAGGKKMVSLSTWIRGKGGFYQVEMSMMAARWEPNRDLLRDVTNSFRVVLDEGIDDDWGE